MDPIDTTFQNLDRWRHLPAYQLERRADIFFSVYLRGLIEECTSFGCDAGRWRRFCRGRISLAKRSGAITLARRR